MQVLSKGGYDDGEQAWLQCAGTTSMKILYWLKRYNLQTDWPSHECKDKAALFNDNITLLCFKTKRSPFL